MCPLTIENVNRQYKLNFTFIKILLTIIIRSNINKSPPHINKIFLQHLSRLLTNRNINLLIFIFFILINESNKQFLRDQILNND